MAKIRTRTAEVISIISSLSIKLSAQGEQVILDLVLVGHDKYYERSWLDDGAGGAVHVMTNAGLLSPRDDQASEPECEPEVTYTDVNSMLLVEVDGEVLEGRAIDPSGAELDRFEIDRRAAR